MRLIRIDNCLAVTATTLLGAYLAAGVQLDTLARALDAAAVAFLLLAAGNVLNDRLDASVDALAQPTRPIPSGRVTPRAADLLFAALTVTGLVAAVPLGPPLVAFTGVIALLSAAYSWRLKNTVLVGNVLIATLSGCTVLYGALAVGGGDWTWIWPAAGDIFFLMVAYEVIKCVQDHESDGDYGLRTISTVFGTRFALRFALGSLVIFSLLVISVGLSPAASFAYRVGAVVVLTLVATSAVQLGRYGPDADVLTSSLLLLKISWLVGVVALALLRT
jgi:geranylgeranylglycerol-phosphate geranylgeranyltransferase